MLTSDLVRARVRGGAIRPLVVSIDDPSVADLACRVYDAFEAGKRSGSRLGEILAELEDIGQSSDAKIGRGLMRIAQDRCVTEVEAALDPPALRMEVFLLAAQRRPLLFRPSADPEMSERYTAARILEEVGAAHGISGAQLAEELYADLPAERRVDRFDVPDPSWLVNRYNVALVQALLVGAVDVKLSLQKASVPRMRQLVRWIKFEQLLFKATAAGSERVDLVIDGPVSLFGPSTRYGLNLARLFPAILLQDPPWRMEATVLWTKARHKKQLVVTSDDGYASHYSDTGAYRTRTLEHLIGRFGEPVRGWSLSTEVAAVPLGSELLFPDFHLEKSDEEGKKTVHVEVLGFWRADALAQRLVALDNSPDTKLVFAVSRKLKGGDQVLPEDPRVVPFTDVLSPNKLVEAAESLFLKRE